MKPILIWNGLGMDPMLPEMAKVVTNRCGMWDERYPRSLSAYAFEPPLVSQLPRNQWGTDTEDSVFVSETARFR
jgi:hypothetical protein